MPKSLFIQTGDFFFKYRNSVFPVIILALFLVFSPTNHSLAGSAAAILVSLAGLIVRAVVIGFAYIKRGGLQKKVYADKLVTEGMFTLCRNPLYVGNMLIYSGIFLLHGNPYVVVGGTTVFFFIYQSIIAAEEYFLREKFGEDYNKYCRNVSRWVPNLLHFKRAIDGRDFCVKRVILKDYSTITTCVGIILLLLAYEHTPYLYGIGALLAANIAFAFGIRYFKKKGAFGAV